jgi:UDP-N-acetylglucosamine 1-carboxyvinyltransferase
MCLANGKSIVVENVFENRFAHVPELLRMGAHITIQDNHTALINAYLNNDSNKSPSFTSTDVKATDLRAAFSLIIAALVATGESVVHKLHHLDRGYNNVDGNLKKLGANIVRLS